MSYHVANQWPGGFQGGVAITNSGDTPDPELYALLSAPRGEDHGPARPPDFGDDG